MNVLVLALIGTPLIAGLVLRFVKFDAEKMKASVMISTLVFAAVGVGYGFMTFKNPKPFLAEHGVVVLACALALIGLVVGLAVDTKQGDEFGSAVFFALIFAGLAYGFQHVAAKLEYVGLTPALGALLLFCMAGALNAVLGPISAGFTISAALHSLVTGGGVNDVHLWKDFFEFFEIASTPLKVFLMFAASLASAADTLHSFFD